MAKLGNPQETIQVLQKHDFHFQKKFGQNFLIDPHVLDKIIEAAEVTKDDFVLEIGPGIGTMTQYLAEAAREVVAVEIDTKLIPILQEVQAVYKYLSKDMISYVATSIGVPPSRVYGVATFYAHFSMQPKGKYIIKVCDGTACHVRKSMPVKEAMLKELGLSHKKHTTDDMMFTVETVSCLGALSLIHI